MKKLIQRSLEKAIKYPEYRALMTKLIEEGKTSGPNQSDYFLEVTKLNQQRMSRLDRKSKLTESVTEFCESIAKEYTFLVLTENWCGDAAQSVPAINWIASSTEKIELKVLFRDENLELMDLFLTEKGRSIPKLIILDEAQNVLADWGPRPQVAQQMLNRFKRSENPDKEAFQKDLHRWYAKDKTLSTQNEIIALLKWLENE